MAAEPEYVLTRDYVDNNRINLQHYLWCELFAYHLHPKIPTQSPDLRVADVGTGTGIWLTDVSARLPKSVHLDGLDISFNATPPQEWLAPNIHLRHWNVKEDVPDDLAQRYDIVHIRMFAFVLKDDEISQVISRLVALLKPGGYLQWGDPDLTSFRIEKTSPANKSSAQEQLIALTASTDPRLKSTWVSKLPDLFKECGLEDIEADVRESPPDLALAMHECNLVLHELILQQTKDHDIAQKLKTLVPEAAVETRAGSCHAFTRWTVVGRKPTV